MSNTDCILELLDIIKPKKYCDDCLSKELNITPRQQVNQICNKLAEIGKISRKKRICDKCGEIKNSNLIGIDNTPNQKDDVSRRVPLTSKGKSGTVKDFDIERIRTQIVHICQKVWDQNKNEIPPKSISSVINILKNDKYLPDHQANMMLTLCGMRNEYVYNALRLGDSEKIVASNAWKIITDWWNSIK